MNDETSDSPSDRTKSVEILISAEDNEPIPNATVRLSGTAFDTRGSTSQTGRCSLTFFANSETVIMEVTHPNYEAVKEELTLRDGAVVDLVLRKLAKTAKKSDELTDESEPSSIEYSKSNQESPTREVLIKELIRLDGIHSRKVTRGHMRRDGAYKPEDYENEFGSWSAALEAVSFPEQEENKNSETQKQRQDPYTKKEVLDAIANVIETVDGSPDINEMNKYGEISPSPAYRYFDSWGDAVDAAERRLVENKYGSTSEDDHDSHSDDTGESEGHTVVQDDTTEKKPDGQAADKNQIEADVTSIGESEDAVNSNINSNISSADFAELTSFQRDLLLVVNGLSDPKGLEIKDELEMYYNGEIHHGRLYPNLDTLVEEDFVKKTARDERSNQYKLTEYGAIHLKKRWRWQQRCSEQHRGQESHNDAESHSTSSVKPSGGDISIEGIESKEETSEDDGQPVPEPSEQNQNLGQTTEENNSGPKHDPLAGDITGVPEQRLSGVVLEVMQKRNIHTDNRDAVFDVETAGGEQVDLTIWSKHDVRIDFAAGDSIQLDEVRLKRWETDYGYTHRLSSTKDLKITLLDEEQETEDTEVDTQPEIKPFIGVGGATESDAKTLLEAGYTSIDDLRNASLEELRSITELDDGTALRIKAELG